MSARTSETVRQKAIKLVAGGMSRRKAGRQLGISSVTVGRIVASAPFDGKPPTGPANPPPRGGGDQPRPPGREFRKGHHDRTYKAATCVTGYEGWDIDRVRNAIAMHDQGRFQESATLAVVATRFAPVFAALSQAVAPALALPRHITGGTTGLSGLLRLEIEHQLAPRAGLMPSVHFPPTLWGSAAIEIRMMGFSVLQHVYGEPDPDTAIRQVYTRRWPAWAVGYDSYRRTYYAITTDGPIDIISGDGKFTLLADTDTPHLDGAIRALAFEVTDGSLAKQSRATYIDRYGNPKAAAYMPEGAKVHSPEGDAMLDAMDEFQGPDGIALLPYSSKFETSEMTAAQNSVFESVLANVWRHIAAALLGSDGTMSPSTGVYSAPIFAGVRRDLVERLVKSMVRGINAGHIAPSLQHNYSRSIAEDPDWVTPALNVPLPNPQADAQSAAFGAHVLTLNDIIAKERANGFVVDQARVNELAAEMGVPAPTLAEEKAKTTSWNVQLAPTTQEKLLRVDEGRAALGGDPIGDERGDLLIVEMDAETKAQAEADAAIEVDKETTDAPDSDKDDENDNEETDS